MPSASATICESPVKVPCPISTTPVTSETLPSSRKWRTAPASVKVGMAGAFQKQEMPFARMRVRPSAPTVSVRRPSSQRSRFCTARMQAPRSPVLRSSTAPVGTVSPALMALRSRSSAGSMPSFSASRSIARSTANDISIWPKPR